MNAAKNATKQTHAKALRLWSFACVALLIVTLIPLYAVSLHNHASVDDFSHSAAAKAVWEQTSSIPAVLKTAAQYTAGVYRTWQGCYTDTFLAALDPLFLGESGSKANGFIILTVFVLSLFYASGVLFRDILRCEDRSAGRITAAVCAMLLTQMIPSPAEGFYWWSGAEAYTLFFALNLVEISAVARLLTAKRCGWGRALRFALAGFLLSGGGFNVALFHVELLFLMLLAAWVQKRENRRVILLIFAVSLAGFLLSVLAPGNAIRRSTSSGSSMLASVVYALYAAVRYAGAWMSPLLGVMLAFLVPVFCATPVHPWFVRRSNMAVCLLGAGLGLCLIASLIAPVIYGYGPGYTPWRTENTYFFAFVLVLILLELLVVQGVRGWLLWRFGNKGASETPWHVRWLTPYLAFCLWLAVIVVLDYKICNDRNRYASTSAVYALRDGEIEAYETVTQERTALLKSDEPDVVLPYMSVRPHLLFVDDARQDPTAWQNQSFAGFYGKNSVRVSPPSAGN